jgi:hypothetical protein
MFISYPRMSFIFSIANPVYLTATKGINVIQMIIPNKNEALPLNLETRIENNHTTAENTQPKINVPIPPQR